MAQLIEGQPQYIKGSGAKPYELKNTGGVFSCTCPAWRNQGVAIDKRTCKHLKALLGDASELARTLGAIQQVGTNTARTSSTTPNVSKPPSSGDVYKQSIIDRAAAEGRNLRQDEKAKVNGPPVLLAHSFEDSDVDPTGWWVSEKLDGVRAYWDGQNFISRQGNIFHAPAWFKAGLPAHTLDGELWMGRQMFQKTISVVKRQDAGLEWKAVTYVVFDHPDHPGTFEERMAALEALFAVEMVHEANVRVHKHSRCKDRVWLGEELLRIEANGAEGLMIRKPGSLYEAGRSHTLLKVKPFKDAEAKVVGHKPGKGRHKGVCGSLTVEMPNGKQFDVGSGLTDAERRNPPKVGATITYRYTELTNDGLPKCGSFVAVRDYE